MNTKIVYTAFAFLTLSFSGIAQIKTPALSPAATIKQTIGLTDFEINYARPGKRDRVIFGDVLPFNEMWRTGANKNTLFTTSDMIVIGKDTLKAGTYAIFTKPMESAWEIYFYTDTENWGTPEKWDDSKVALKTKAQVTKPAEVIESFTIAFEDMTTNTANLSFAWDNVKVEVPIRLMTEMRTIQGIDRVMAGPSAADYFASARYYYDEKKDMKKALEWVDKSISMQKDAPFYYYRLKSLIQAETGDKKGAVATAKVSLGLAEKAGNKSYIEMNKKSIEEWSK